MVLKTIFQKPVDRHIEGVIKADDEASLRLEVEEYVLTNEVAKRLEEFLYAYNNYEGANGAWISGFFGSGKSHLLKILALLMENRAIDGTPVLDLFLPKCANNEFLSADLKKAAAVPSKSILFNIDQKADVISKTQIDALLTVFVKVFDETCGYYGKQGHIARFERDLDSRGLFEDFKQAFLKISGSEWQRGREQAVLESKNIKDAYARVTGRDTESAAGILDKYRSEYKVSIEDFADMVHDYIEKQEPGFRLNFFVDEVGQFIADNVKLMTNLQTIAESLNTKCRGRAWLIVTAQEDMNTIVGEMEKQKGNDFSKIQDRFKKRMKLTSADVAEVIQKRLLLKNDDGVKQLASVHQAQVNNFKTLFDFADGSQEYRNFRDEEHFIHSYPFIPYQFDLFQTAIQNLSLHNAFEGKHSSVGERSMLGVFQQVAIHISEQEIGRLATFDLMFEGIRTALKSQIQHAVIMAEKNLGDLFAVRVLKALFLVKYIKEFKATPRNICVLMIDCFDRDLEALRKEVREALNRLEQQTYIQRSGELYEYLTDEEKDVEQEIKNTEVENADIAEELKKIIFDSIINTTKIRYDNKIDYNYSRKIDNQLMGREYELTMHVVTPLHEHHGKVDNLKAHSMVHDELVIVLPADDRFAHDILMYKKTDKYIRQNISITQRSEVKRILSAKQIQNRERLADIEQKMRSLLGKASLFVKGNEIELPGEEPQARIIKGFFELVLRTYPHLRMLRDIPYSVEAISTYLEPSSLFAGDSTEFSEAEQEMMGFIQTNKNGGVRTTLKTLMEKFEHKPYGWYMAAVLCILAKLCARGKVDVRSGAGILENAALEKALLNSKEHAAIVLEPLIEYTADQVRRLKDFYKDFFDAQPRADEARELGKETAAAFSELTGELERLKAEAVDFPFSKELDRALERVKEVQDKSYNFYLEKTGNLEELHDLKETFLEPLLNFMNGPQKLLFKNAVEFIKKQDSNFDYIEGEENREISEILSDPECFKGNRMQQVKSLTDSLEKKVADQLRKEKEKAEADLTFLKEKMTAVPDFAALSTKQQQELTVPFNEVSVTIRKQFLIAVVCDKLKRFEEGEYQSLLGKMIRWAHPEAPDKAEVEYISIRSVHAAFDKALLAGEQDVDDYLKALKQALMAEIGKGKRVRV